MLPIISLWWLLIYHQQISIKSLAVCWSLAFRCVLTQSQREKSEVIVFQQVIFATYQSARKWAATLYTSYKWLTKTSIHWVIIRCNKSMNNSLKVLWREAVLHLTRVWYLKSCSRSANLLIKSEVKNYAKVPAAESHNHLK